MFIFSRSLLGGGRKWSDEWVSLHDLSGGAPKLESDAGISLRRLLLFLLFLLEIADGDVGTIAFDSANTAHEIQRDSERSTSVLIVFLALQDIGEAAWFVVVLLELWALP